MPYLPIEDAGIPYQFGSTGGITMVGSVVSGTNVDAGTFDLTLTQFPQATFQVTCLNYLLSGAPSTVATFSTINDGDSVEVPNTGGAATFTPSPFPITSFIEAGEAYLSYLGANAVAPLQETFAYLIKVFIDPVQEQTPPGRTFKGYASAYSAKQTQPRRVLRFQRRRLIADFNGAISKDRSIVSATWECTSPWATYMQNALISQDQKSATVDVSFNFSGWGWIKCTATLDDESTLNYEFCFTVVDGPMYPNSVYLNNSGPFSITATV